MFKPYAIMKHDFKAIPVRWLFLLLLLLVVTGLPARAQQFGMGHILDPIRWKATVESNATSSAVIRLTADIDEGWHLYSLDLPDDGDRKSVV